MKIIMIALALLLSACNKVPSVPPPRIAEPQALQKAKDVEQTLQKDSEAEQKNINEATGK